MSNDPFGRAVTNLLDPYWKDHPIQRDLVHGGYHLIRGIIWALLWKKDKADADFQRTNDHWIRGENRNNREAYNLSPSRSKWNPIHYTFKNCRKKSE